MLIGIRPLNGMPDGLQARADVVPIKMEKWITFCLLVLCLMGCTAPGTTPTPIEKEEWQMNETLIRLIADGVGCNEYRATAILETLQQVNVAEPAAVRSAGKKDNSIILETVTGEKYEVGLDKMYYVFSIKALATGKYIYMVIE